MSKQEIENAEYFHQLKLKVFETQLEDIFQTAKKEKLEIITIKGWAVARLYKSPQTRIFNDIDICIKPEQFNKKNKLLEEKYPIDFHKGLRHLDNLSWDALYSNSKVIETENPKKIRILSDEDHLRILVVHWLTDSGTYKQRLWDFYFLLESNKDFDWEKCLDVVSETRRKWIICTLGLAEIYTDLDLSKTPIYNAQKQIPKWLFKALEKEWKSGVHLQPFGSFWNGNKKHFWEQLKKRVPPNPILATVYSEGKFDESSRLKYQIENVFIRAKESLSRRFGK